MALGKLFWVVSTCLKWGGWLAAILFGVHPSALLYLGVGAEVVQFFEQPQYYVPLIVVLTIFTWHDVIVWWRRAQERKRDEPRYDMTMQALFRYLRFDAKASSGFAKNDEWLTRLPLEIEDELALGKKYLACWGRCAADRDVFDHGTRRPLDPKIWNGRTLELGSCFDSTVPWARTRIIPDDPCNRYYDLWVNKAQVRHRWPKANLFQRLSVRAHYAAKTTDWMQSPWWRRMGTLAKRRWHMRRIALGVWLARRLGAR